MSESETVACLRCGDFVVPGALPLPGLELCAKCLEGEPARPETSAGGAARRVIVVLGLALVGAFAGGWGGLSLATLFEANLGAGREPLSELAWTWSFAFLGALLLGAGGWAATSDPEGKLLETLGLARARDRFWPTAFFEKPASSFTWPTQEWGLLAPTPHGLAFLGARGARCVLRVQNMTAARAVFDWRIVGGWVLEVELESGRTTVFVLPRAAARGLAVVLGAMLPTRRA